MFILLNLKYIEYCSIFIIKVLSDINTCKVQFMKKAESCRGRCQLRRKIYILVLLVKRKKSTDHRFANAKILNQKFYTQSQISASTFFC